MPGWLLHMPVLSLHKHERRQHAPCMMNAVLLSLAQQRRIMHPSVAVTFKQPRL